MPVMPVQHILKVNPYRTRGGADNGCSILRSSFHDDGQALDTSVEASAVGGCHARKVARSSPQRCHSHLSGR
jgi:hypothetical protein